MLNQDNPHRYAKDIAFSKRLGYVIDNWEKLSGEIKTRAKLYLAKPKWDTGHGMKYEQVIVLYGKKTEIPRMTSSYIKAVEKNGN